MMRTVLLWGSALVGAPCVVIALGLRMVEEFAVQTGRATDWLCARKVTWTFMAIGVVAAVARFGAAF